MPYDTRYLSLKSHIPNEVGGQEWWYDTTDAISVVRAANYVSDALVRGMEKGDFVWVRVWSALPNTSTAKQTGSGTAPTLSAVQQMVVLGVASTGADLSDGSAITLTNT